MPQAIPAAVGAIGSFFAAAGVSWAAVGQFALVLGAEAAFDEELVAHVDDDEIAHAKRLLESMRAPTLGPMQMRRQMVLPYCVTGDCLAPLVSAGDLVLVDPTRRPVHGDIVVVRLTPDCHRAVSTTPAWQRAVAEHGENLEPLLVKGWFVIDGEPQLVSNAGYIWPGHIKELLGTVVHHERRRVVV